MAPTMLLAWCGQGDHLSVGGLSLNADTGWIIMTSCPFDPGNVQAWLQNFLGFCSGIALSAVSENNSMSKKHRRSQYERTIAKNCSVHKGLHRFKSKGIRHHPEFEWSTEILVCDCGFSKTLTLGWD